MLVQCYDAVFWTVKFDLRYFLGAIMQGTSEAQISVKLRGSWRRPSVWEK